MLKNDPFYRSLMQLRTDAIERGLNDLAIVYGWTLLRYGEEIIQRQKKALLNEH